ncbi:MAG: DNA cytosine methyltransferase [Bacteroidota bacterium]
MYTSLELCAGAGGAALGLEQAGFSHLGLVENDKHACNTLCHNRPHWNVIEMDLKEFDAYQFKGVDLVSGGVPCQPFSSGGKQLGATDERDLFPQAIRIIAECQPKLILLENVRGLADDKFSDYRNAIIKELGELGYYCDWKIINAAYYGVSQARLRFVLVGKKKNVAPFPWPQPVNQVLTVGEIIRDLMGENGWLGLDDWVARANTVAPCLVGGSKKHGGADLGPQRAKREWLKLSVDGKGLANAAPEKDFVGIPRLTNRMAARLQGFPDSWEFAGGKTAAYRQIGNAFPPPVTKLLGKALIKWSATKTGTSQIAAPQKHCQQLNLPLVAR